MANQRFESFSEFYPYYLDEHRNRNCRRLHFVGSVLVLAVLAGVLITEAWLWLLAIPVIGYGFAWLGHFIFEKNRPATFKYPLYSLMGDWVMFRDILIGRIRF
ncbi:Mpo1-like protein [Marinobacter lacisalsi]|uniref:Mpo1-like protein n=1 Tax=Marinobacter lacisalsi TaxID=475979 RepID=A0ABV8QF71_9GAMM